MSLGAGLPFCFDQWQTGKAFQNLTTVRNGAENEDLQFLKMIEIFFFHNWYVALMIWRPVFAEPWWRTTTAKRLNYLEMMRKMRWDQKCACFLGMTLVWSASASGRPGPQIRGFWQVWRISAARVCRAVRRQGSSLTRARVQLAFANYTCSPRAERRCGPSPSAMAGGEDVSVLLHGCMKY